jgi:predicted MFS family arabinose efflux permease
VGETATGATARVRDRRGAAAWWWPALVMFTVGYGANQFVPLLAVYRRTLGLSDAQATAVFGVYALGLIPGLLLAGPASDRFGRRPLMLAFAALSLLATGVLITGQWGPAGLYAGRLLTGVVSGGAFSVGTAWVKELSTGAAPGAGARRGALALTAGFAAGPLVGGLLAQWAPGPELLPYLVHLLLAAAALALLPRAPETVPTHDGSDRQRTPQPRLLASSTRTRRFTRVVVPLGPWVFGSVTLVFTTLPAHATGSVAGLDVAFPGVLAAVALAAGIAAQPLAHRLQNAAVTRGTADASAVALAVVTAGCLAAVAATAHPGVVAATGAAVLLGAGYGMAIICGLREVEHLAPTHELGGLVAVFYSLAYSGLAIPYLLALAGPHLGYPTGLLLLTLLAALTTVLLAVQGRRHPATTRSASSVQNT